MIGFFSVSALRNFTLLCCYYIVGSYMKKVAYAIWDHYYYLCCKEHATHLCVVVSRRQCPLFCWGVSSVIDLPKKWKVSPKTNAIMGNSGTVTVVAAVPWVAPLYWFSILTYCSFIRNSECLNTIYLFKFKVTESNVIIDLLLRRGFLSIIMHTQQDKVYNGPRDILFMKMNKRL